MGNSPSCSPSDTPPISLPRSLSSRSTMPRSPVLAAQTVDSSAPPPYTPVASPQETPPPVPPRVPKSQENPPPPVPPRDVRRTNLSVAATGTPRSHRRIASHSHLQSARTLGPTSTNDRAPGGGVGGFISPQQSHPGSSFTRANTVAARYQDATTSVRTNSTAAAFTSQASSGSTSTVTASASGAEPVRNIPAPRKPVRQNSKENPFDLLRKFDTIIIVDDSSSMEGALWIEARDALGGIADAAARYGISGIDLYFLNDRRVGKKLKSAVEVERLFDTVTPSGITPTGEKLEELLLDYLLRLETSDTEKPEKPKPVNLVILTDGAPTDDPESVIVAAAKRLDGMHAPISQVGIQFVQLGSDLSATKALQELDDELANKHNIRDMVDTTLYTGQQLTTELLGKILLGGINRRVDKVGYRG